ncbi:hypothetical protein [Ureaplasma ceti]
MVRGFHGTVIYSTEDSVYFVNSHDCLEIYNNHQQEWKLNQNYFLYVYEQKVLSGKSVEHIVNFGFTKITDCITFKNLLGLSGIGVKTAYKLLQYGIEDIQQYVQMHDVFDVMEHYKISEKVANTLVDHFIKNDCSTIKNPNDMKKINDAIYYLQELGYSKQLSTKVVWNRRNEVLQKNFSQIFSTLIGDIKNERCKFKTE